MRRRSISPICVSISSRRYASVILSARASAASTYTVPSPVTAPNANSGFCGARSLRGIATSSGQSCARTSASATSTPPRGIASTAAGPRASAPSSRARCSPASRRSRNRIGVRIRSSLASARKADRLLLLVRELLGRDPALHRLAVDARSLAVVEHADHDAVGPRVEERHAEAHVAAHLRERVEPHDADALDRGRQRRGHLRDALLERLEPAGQRGKLLLDHLVRREHLGRLLRPSPGEQDDKQNGGRARGREKDIGECVRREVPEDVQSVILPLREGPDRFVRSRARPSLWYRHTFAIDRMRRGRYLYRCVYV